MNVVRVSRVRDPARRPDVLHHRPIGFQRPRARKQAIRDDAPLKRLVLVIVGGDEARHHDRARAVDDFGVGGGDRRRNLGDRLPVDQDVRLLEVADLRVEAEHDASPQQNAALAAIADEVLEVGRSRRAEPVELPHARGPC